MADEPRWWKVQAELIVRAETEDDAIDRAAKAIRLGYANSHGVIPVGTFRAQPHRDHMTDALDRQSAEVLSGQQRRVLERMAELEDGWRRQGYMALVSSHHLRPPISNLGLGNDRQVRRFLNDLVDAGVVETVRDGRYKCWRLRPWLPSA